MQFYLIIGIKRTLWLFPKVLVFLTLVTSKNVKITPLASEWTFKVTLANINIDLQILFSDGDCLHVVKIPLDVWCRKCCIKSVSRVFPMLSFFKLIFLKILKLLIWWSPYGKKLFDIELCSIFIILPAVLFEFACIILLLTLCPWFTLRGETSFKSCKFKIVKVWYKNIMHIDH